MFNQYTTSAAFIPSRVTSIYSVSFDAPQIATRCCSTGLQILQNKLRPQLRHPHPFSLNMQVSLTMTLTSCVFFQTNDSANALLAQIKGVYADNNEKPKVESPVVQKIVGRQK